jgi:hypothetical protein
MKQNITIMVAKTSYSVTFKPNDIFLESIFYVYSYIYFMGHERP